jgi:hypothetical protein
MGRDPPERGDVVSAIGGPGIPQPQDPRWNWEARAIEQPVLVGPGHPSAGERPSGAHGLQLGAFGSLRTAAPETVVSTAVGQHVGDVRPEVEAREALRWVRGVSVEDGAGLGVEVASLGGMGLVRTVVIDGARYWRRMRERSLTPDDFRKLERTRRDPWTDSDALANGADRRAIEATTRGLTDVQRREVEAIVRYHLR